MSAPNPEHILSTGLAFWASKALLSAVELELFTELAKGPANLESLTRRLGIHPRSARDFLDAMVALGFLQREGGLYANTPATDHFLDKRKSSYIGGVLEFSNSVLYPHWGRLTNGLRTGECQIERATESDLFSDFYADPEGVKNCVGAMTGLSNGTNVAIASRFPWSDYETVADIGTAQGDLIVQVALKNQHISGIGFDLPQVAPVFEEYVEVNGLSPRVRFQSGDFFNGPLPKADVIMMGHILHDWNLAQKRTLIRKAYEAIPSGGAFIVYESLIDDDRSKNGFGLLMSLNMLIGTPGGFDYTGADCVGWLNEAGFRETRAEHLVGPDSMVIGIK